MHAFLTTSTMIDPTMNRKFIRRIIVITVALFGSHQQIQRLFLQYGCD